MWGNTTTPHSFGQSCRNSHQSPWGLPLWWVCLLEIQSGTDKLWQMSSNCDVVQSGPDIISSSSCFLICYVQHC
jgi:hypothetical protein